MNSSQKSPEAQDLYVASLRPEAARRIAELEKKLHRPENREGTEDLRTILRNAEAEDANLSLGFFRGHELIGYGIAYLESSSYLDIPSPGGVVYFHDFALLPEYWYFMRPIVRKIVETGRLIVPGIPVEAHFHAKEDWLFKISDLLMRRYHYDLVSSELRTIGDLPDKRLVARWEPTRLVDRQSGDPRELGASADDLEIEILTTTEQWWSLRHDWEELLERIPEHTVFHEFDFQWLWWKHLSGGSRLFVVTVKVAGRVEGIAPLYIRQSKFLGGRFRELGLIGTPWETDRARILYPDGADRVLAAIVATLLAQRSRWDLLILWEQPSYDFSVGYIARQLRHNGLLTTVSHTDPGPFLQLQGDWSDYLETRSRRLRKNLRRSQRQLESLGKLQYLEIDSESEAEERLNDYLALEQHSWKPKNDLGIGRSDERFAFFKDLARHYGKEGQFQIRFLELDGNPIAATFGILHQETFFSLRIVHDEKFASSSPGTLLESLELESLFASEVSRYDFLCGFLDNKMRWTDSVEEISNIHAFSNRWRLRLFHLLYFRLKSHLRDFLVSLGIFERLARRKKDLTRRLKRALRIKENQD